MHTHGPKRVYNNRALEAWFARLTESWERHFPGEALHRGRRFYREGVVREIELTEEDAIVHSKWDGRDCHAVIEWAALRPSTRSSLSDMETGRALAVAGLYEIEEMVIDEIAPVPAETPAAEKGPEDARAVSPVPAAEPESPPRDLLLRFEVTTRALSFRAFWMSGGAKECPALFNGLNGNRPVTAAERETLIRLALLARKAHFALAVEGEVYELEEIPAILFFLRQELANWRRYFRIELSPEVKRLGSGIRQVEVTARARSSGGGLDLEWIFRAGDTLLGEEERELLLRKRGNPVYLPGLGVVEMPSATSEAVRDWRERVKAVGRSPEGGLPAYMMFSLFSERRFPVEAGEEMTAKRKILTQARVIPPGASDYLRNYQKRGVEWMARLCDLGCHPLLADEMGLGKTVQVISLLATRPLPENAHLVVAPASVIPVWQKELARFYPGTEVHVLKNGNPVGEKPAPGIWLASYAQVRRHGEELSRVAFGYAVLDEGQVIKNPAAKVSQCCHNLRARHRIVLTGTPLENRQLDLWSLFHFLMPGLLGTRVVFEDAVQREGDAFLRKLRSQVAPFVLRRTKKRVASELPEKIEMTLASPLGELQRREYARICREGLERLGDDISATMRGHSFGLFALLTRLRQISCDPGLLPWLDVPWRESGKILLLMEKLADIFAGGHKVVVFSQFVSLLQRVETALGEVFPGVERFRLTGATTDRLQPVEAFQEHEGAGVMLVSLKAGGTGITLHAADYLFLLDPWWNPAVENQAIDRVHRIGQTNKVFVYRMVASGTIEERIQDLKERKKDLFDSVIGGLGGDGVRGDYQSLRGLIELADEAVSTGPA